MLPVFTLQRNFRTAHRGGVIHEGLTMYIIGTGRHVVAIRPSFRCSNCSVDYEGTARQTNQFYILIEKFSRLTIQAAKLISRQNPYQRFLYSHNLLQVSLGVVVHAVP